LSIQELCQSFNLRLELGDTVFLSFGRSKSTCFAESYTSFAWWWTATCSTKLTFDFDRLAVLTGSTAGLGWHGKEECCSASLLFVVKSQLERLTRYR
jgi:hypothetical protein